MALATTLPSEAQSGTALAPRIADQALNHSQVLQTAAYLSDRIGGRLTNSPAMREAEQWTQGRFTEWGLAKVHTEGFDFGRGWEVQQHSVEMRTPRRVVMHSIPVAWTPSTNGVIESQIVVAPVNTVADFSRWHGKLTRKVVLVTVPSIPVDDSDAPFARFSDTDISRSDTYRQPTIDHRSSANMVTFGLFASRLDAFLKAEGALAWISMAGQGNGVVGGEGYSYQPGRTPALPGFEVAAEDYRRMVRLSTQGPVTVRLQSDVSYFDNDLRAYNILADVPGRDGSTSYVMAGAHLDSWDAGDGAADNAAGVAIVMEAARIIAALHVQPRRTIRFALWAGEEQGLYGSSDYIARHLATRPPETDADKKVFGPFVSETWPITPLPGFNDLAAYFNVDNGSGRVRGLYGENNLDAIPILRGWLAPFTSMGANTVLTRPTKGSDQQFMARLGLPAFEVLQDPLDYPRVHHTNLDTVDHLRAQDLRQAAIVLAGILLDAADTPEGLPHNPLPTEPTDTDPFLLELPIQH